MSSINIPKFSIRNIQEINLAGLEKGNLLAFDGKQFSLVPKGNDAQFLMAHSLFTNGMSWMDINSFRAYRNITKPTNTSSPYKVGISAIGIWTVFNHTSFVVGETLNFSGSNLQAIPSLNGIYFCSGEVSFMVSGGFNSHVEFGISLNGNNPTTNHSLFIQEVANNVWTSAPISCIITANIGDVIGLACRNLSVSTKIQIASLHLNIIKIAEI
ncbi:MAG: hypothetical protein KDH96_09875 [Candidatus Riesia sp.]|nr:hypothetical protein [Candidatus Riesia sp.]